MLFLVIQTCLFYCATHTSVELPQAKVTVTVLCVLCVVVYLVTKLLRLSDTASDTARPRPPWYGIFIEFNSLLPQEKKCKTKLEPLPQTHKLCHAPTGIMALQNCGPQDVLPHIVDFVINLISQP